MKWKSPLQLHPSPMTGTLWCWRSVLICKDEGRLPRHLIGEAWKGTVIFQKWRCARGVLELLISMGLVKREEIHIRTLLQQLIEIVDFLEKSYLRQHK